MNHAMSSIFADASLIYLSGLVAAALFFIMIGLRDINDARAEGILYVTLGVFFFSAHFYYLMGLPDTTPLGSAGNLNIVWSWLACVFAPALIALFVLIGLYNFIITQVKLGLTKIFFGLSLSACLYWVGLSWALDIKGVLTLIWTIIWFDVELEAAG